MAAYGSTCGFATHFLCEGRYGCSVYQRPRNPGDARPAPLRLSPAPRSFKVAVHCVIGFTPPPCIQAMNFSRFVSRIRVTFQPIPSWSPEGGGEGHRNKAYGCGHRSEDCDRFRQRESVSGVWGR